MAQETTATIQVEVKLPELTKKLISTLQAIMNLPEDWKREATITVGDLIDAISDSMLPEGEHDEEVCSIGIINCPECVSAQ